MDLYRFSNREIIRKTPRIYDVNTPCTAETLYSGTVTITGDSFTGGYRLRENRNGVNVLTLNLQHTYDFANAIDFVNSNTNFTSSGWTSFSIDRPALDAHLGAESVLDYWRTVHGRNSIDGNGMAVNSGVHYGSGVTNAFWDANATVMYYGDGDGITFKPLTALDVCGHETGHGITQYTCNLNYTYGQESSALNEGFSDIWGACVEHVAAPNKQMWLMGEEIFISTYNAIRNLQNPRASNLYEGPHPDTYHGDYWDPYGEPHFNSTVLSHWFYLLVTGGTGWNDGHTSHAAAGIGYQWSVSGIGISDAQRIAYRTELLYLMPTADYTATRNATIQATIDIFGVNSCQEKSVKDAWNAVGIGSSYFGSPLSVTGDDFFCATTSNQYTLTNLSSGVPIQWTATPSGVVTINSPNSQQTTLTKLADGIVTLTATLHNPCTNTQIEITKPNIKVGAPLASLLTAVGTTRINSPSTPGYYGFTYNGVNCNQVVSRYGITDVQYQYAPSPPAYGYSGGMACDITGLGYTIFWGSTGTKSVTVRVKNSCGWSNWSQPLFVTVTNGYYFTVAPNPANSNVTVSATENNSNATSSSFDEVRIYDQQGNLKLSKKFGKVKTGAMNISNLGTGIYIIEISSGDYKERQQLLVQK